MQDVFVIALDGMKLMPTNRAKARKLFKKAWILAAIGQTEEKHAMS